MPWRTGTKMQSVVISLDTVSSGLLIEFSHPIMMICYYLVLTIFVNSKLISVVPSVINPFLLLLNNTKLPLDPEKMCFVFLVSVSCSLEISASIYSGLS